MRMAGTLIQTENSVLGDMTFAYLQNPADCLSGRSAFSLSGSFSGNDLKLTSAPTNGEVITLKLTGTGDGLAGTYTVTDGGTACDDQGTGTAAIIPPITGSWSGTVYNPDGTPSFTDIYFDIAQAPFATAGYSPLSGTGKICQGDPSNPRVRCVTQTACTISTASDTLSEVVGDVVVIYCGSVHYSAWIINPATSTAMFGLYQNYPFPYGGALTMDKIAP